MMATPLELFRDTCELAGDLIVIPVSLALILPLWVVSALKSYLRPTKRVYKSIVITGASSGIGAQLATKLAGPGVTMLLIARDIDRLKEVKEECVAKGARVEIFSTDLASKLDLYQDELLRFDSANPVDLLISNAAELVYTSSASERDWTSKEFYCHLLDTNISGVVITTQTLVPRFQSRKRGTIMMTSSINAFLPPGQQMFYNMSKAAILSYSESLRTLLDKDSITVSVLIPGLTNTRLAQLLWKEGKSTFPKPLSTEEDVLATIAVDQLKMGATTIAPSVWQYVTAKLVNTVPLTLKSYIVKAHYLSGVGGAKQT